MASNGIRRAVAADLDRLLPLFDAYRQFYGLASDLPAARVFLADRFAQQDAVLFVLEVGETLGGFLQLYPLWSSTRMARIWQLNDLFVAPEYRGAGWGRAFMAVAKQHCKDTAAIELCLETAPDNQAANRLYLSEGFKNYSPELNIYRWQLA